MAFVYIFENLIYSTYAVRSRYKMKITVTEEMYYGRYTSHAHMYVRVVTSPSVRIRQQDNEFCFCTKKLGEY